MILDAALATIGVLITLTAVALLVLAGRALAWTRPAWIIRTRRAIRRQRS